MGREERLERWLGWRQVRELTGLGRTTAWRMRQDGDFPDPVPISPGRVAWRERDIAAWTATRGLARPSRSPSPSPPPKRSALPERRCREPHILTAPADPIPETAGLPLAEKRSSKPKLAKRPRAAIAEGQLGFDF